MSTKKEWKGYYAFLLEETRHAQAALEEVLTEEKKSDRANAVINLQQNKDHSWTVSSLDTDITTTASTVKAALEAFLTLRRARFITVPTNRKDADKVIAYRRGDGSYGCFAYYVDSSEQAAMGWGLTEESARESLERMS